MVLGGGLGISKDRTRHVDSLPVNTVSHKVDRRVGSGVHAMTDKSITSLMDYARRMSRYTVIGQGFESPLLHRVTDDPGSSPVQSTFEGCLSGTARWRRLTVYRELSVAVPTSL